MKRAKVIGSSVPRAESAEKVTGLAVYAVEFLLRYVVGKVLRSPIASGRIKRIDVTAAAALPGVKSVAVGAELRRSKSAGKFMTCPFSLRTWLVSSARRLQPSPPKRKR